MSDVFALVLLPHLKVQNANAISGPLTWGFPSPTAFAGFVHALERKFVDELVEGFAGVGIICHHFEPQVFQPPGRRTQVFRLTRNPVGKDGGTLALVEEGRAHMEVSLVIAVKDYKSEGDGKDLAERLHHAAQGMRLAGGSLLHQEGKRYQAQWWPLAGDVEGDAKVFRQLRRRLLPGFALVQRDDLLASHLAEMRVVRQESHALDALLDLSRLNIEPVASSSSDTEQPVKWEIRRKPGWLVPLPIGYAGISPLYAPGEVENARDAATPFRFVESLYSLGEWISPHRLEAAQTWNFEALKFSLRSFDAESAELTALANVIEQGLAGKSHALLEVVAFVRVGDGQEVYPSQELILDRGDKKGQKSNSKPSPPLCRPAQKNANMKRQGFGFVTAGQAAQKTQRQRLSRRHGVTAGQAAQKPEGRDVPAMFIRHCRTGSSEKEPPLCSIKRTRHCRTGSSENPLPGPASRR